MRSKFKPKQLAPKVQKSLTHTAASRGAGHPEHNSLIRKVKKGIKRRARV